MSELSEIAKAKGNWAEDDAGEPDPAPAASEEKEAAAAPTPAPAEEDEAPTVVNDVTDKETSTTAAASTAKVTPEVVATGEPVSAAAAETSAPAPAAAAAAAVAATAAATEVDVEKEAARIARMFLAPESEDAKTARLKVIAANPESHLSSAKSFEDLNLPPALLRGIRTMGFHKPSSIQEMALPMVLKDPPENLIAQAQSGSGKTVAFCLGMLYRIDPTKNVPQAVVITPTRELAVQCYEQTLLPMAQHIEPPLRVMLGLRGTNIERGKKVTEQIVVGTPGKMEEWIRRRMLDTNGIKVFVLDEADQMLDLGGFADQCRKIKKCISVPHQSLLFSATFPQGVVDFARTIIRPPINEIRLASDEELVLEEITQLWIDLRSKTDRARVELLQDLYELLEMGQSIIFCRTRAETDRITATLQRSGFNCSNLHSKLEPAERDECMASFRSGKNKVLITTNVLARGVDVPAVSLVINYDMPTLERSSEPDFETYLHRIGRTGRFGRRGVAINFVETDQSLRVMEAIEKHFSPHKPMIIPAPADVEELEGIVGQKLS
ncbi:unnamed protein product [Chrysoparadoxa australica]